MAIGRVNAAGGTKLFAAIGVTYPAGSTVTCTNGAKTLAAKNTSGQWVFAVPSTGTWTVTATNGVDSVSQSVSLVEGHTYSVSLFFGTYLYNGDYSSMELDACPDITGGYVFKYIGQGGQIVQYDDYVRLAANAGAGGYGSEIDWVTANKIDLSTYSTLNVQLNSLTGPGSFSLIVKNNQEIGSSIVSTSITAGTTSCAVDISSLAGAYYIGIVVALSYVQTATTCDVYKLWLK